MAIVSACTSVTRANYAGSPSPGDASPASVANAERLVGIINYKIQTGTFSYARHIPDSPGVKTNTLGNYIDL